MEGFDFILRFSAIGISIVFVALAVIAIAISWIRRADEGWQAKEKQQAEEALDKDQTTDTTTLVLISAACATLLGGKFHIRRVRRLRPSHSGLGPWAHRGRSVLLGSHVVGKKRRY